MFAIDESQLRSQYFTACRQFAENKSMLQKIHESYRILLSPLSRLAELFAIFEQPQPEANGMPSDSVLELFEQLSEEHLSSEQKDQLRKRVAEATTLLCEEIQRKFEKNDWQRIRELRNDLVYYIKMRNF
jgi:hypothetical protein